MHMLRARQKIAEERRHSLRSAHHRNASLLLNSTLNASSHVYSTYSDDAQYRRSSAIFLPLPPPADEKISIHHVAGQGRTASVAFPRPLPGSRRIIHGGNHSSLSTGRRIGNGPRVHSPSSREDARQVHNGSDLIRRTARKINSGRTAAGGDARRGGHIRFFFCFRIGGRCRSRGARAGAST